MQRGDIYLAAFPFGDCAGMKLRPVLLLTGAVGAWTEMVVAYISSVIPTSLLSSDMLMDPVQPEFQTARLKVNICATPAQDRDHPRHQFATAPGPISETVDAELRAVLTL